MLLRDWRSLGLGLMLAFAVMTSWILALTWVPVDAHQGEVYRILYLHVPSAFAAFAMSFVLLCISVLSLWRPLPQRVDYGLATAEIGLLFTILTLATGSIWGRPTWGTWWTWDARLTTTFILGLLYAGYLLLAQSLRDEAFKEKACAVLGVLIFADVPIIYKSVTWWRTLHQPPSILRPEGSTMDQEMLFVLLASVAVMVLFALWLVKERGQNIRLKRDILVRSLNLAKGG